MERRVHCLIFMLQGGQKSLYQIYSQNWEAVQAALKRLVSERARLMGLNMQGTEKFYQQVDALVARATAPSSGAPLAAIDREIMRSLEVDMVEEFLRDPTDRIIRDNLSIELALLTAATNAISGITPFTFEELQAILQGDGTFYDDHIFLYTIRDAMGIGDVKYARLMLATLPRAAAPADLEDRYWWDDALILAVSLQMVWYFFPVLDTAEQIALLQHYFYRSLVIGAPVRKKMQDALNLMTDADTLSALYAIFTKAVLDSDESVPLDKEATEGKDFNEVCKEYQAKVYTEEMSVLEQEKFMAELYANKKIDEVYIVWLREALSIFFHLKRQDIVA